jgi:hypothetical protein
MEFEFKFKLEFGNKEREKKLENKKEKDQNPGWADIHPIWPIFPFPRLHCACWAEKHPAGPLAPPFLFFTMSLPGGATRSALSPSSPTNATGAPTLPQTGFCP